jgi:hypothetical protein
MHFCDGIFAVEMQLKRRGRYYCLSLSKKKEEIIFTVIDLMGRIKWNIKVADLLFFVFTATACIYVMAFWQWKHSLRGEGEIIACH